MTVRFDGLGGCSLVGEFAGRWADPLVLLLHGGGQTRFSWGGTASALAESGYLALSLDLRGHGDSDWASDGDYSIDAFAADLRRVMSQLGRPATLVGASLGGLTGMIAVGESTTTDYTSLILVDVIPRLHEAGKTAIMSFMMADPDGFASVEQAAQTVAEYLPHRPRSTDTTGLRKNLRQRDDGRYYWHWDPRLLSSPRSPRNVREDRLERALTGVQIPILLTRGVHSEIVREDNVALFLAATPDAECVDIPGAGHMVAGDRNDAFTSAIVEFLDRQRRQVREHGGVA